MDRWICLGQVCAKLGFLSSQFNAYVTKNDAYTRSLYASSDVLLSEAHVSFASFRLLKDLWIDFRREGLMTQRPVLNFLLESITDGFLNLTSLTMTAVPRLDTHLLKIVAKTFPSLIDLHLSTVEGLVIDCCPNCFQDSLTRSTHSPVPDIYPNIEMLAVRNLFLPKFFCYNMDYMLKKISPFAKDAFGHSLAPLNKLNRLFLGIFLSDTRVLDDHIDHSENGTVENVFYCKRCEIYEKETRRRELVASLIMARYLESLKHIGWSTCFFWGSHSSRKGDESVIEEVAENKLDNVPSDMGTSNFEECEEKCNVGLTTELFVTRTSTRTSVERVV